MQENHSSGRAHPDPDLATEVDYSPPRGNPFPVVGIGASAGGLEAFAQLLRSLPEGTGLAFVLVQHLDPQHESLLTELIAPATKMPVITVVDGVEIKPDSVYVIPPNASMQLRGNSLRLFPREPGLHLPIDIFFRSLAEVQGSRAIGVVLSGNASDGSLGVRAIKAECGLTFAQDESTARFGGMPRNAVATGAIDFIMAPDAIGREIGRLGHHRFLIPETPGVAESETLPDGDAELRRILAILQSATKVDFSQYKPTTIHRRISRRLMILRVDTLAEYARLLQQNPVEIAELYKDVLISVTCFFRDPDTFDALMRHLKASFGDDGPTEGTIRAWIPGCATGEEVYSLAICLHEFLQERELSCSVQIFGTDISEPALERARQGVYTAAITEDVSEHRLRRFFTKMDGGYQINKVIRESCVFARQDVTRDPPFSRLDIVSCRNVLIYLDTKAQRRVLPSFHYSLNPKGLLMLGSAETTGSTDDLFSTVDKVHHIYSRRAVPTRLVLDLTSNANSADPLNGALRAPSPSGLDLPKTLERIIQSRYSPDAVVVNAEMQILQFRGHTACYLDPSPGEASLNLLRMAGENLVVPLRRAVQKSADTQSVVRDVGGFMEIDGNPEEISLEVTPIVGAHPSERFFLIVFTRTRNTRESGISAPRLPIEYGAEQAGLLQQELTETREYLRTLSEQYEAHSEELRAANEEARSANEELQSTNEELGTTKEELQSANEELTTVNDELQHRNQELAATNGDLRNLLSAVMVSIVMVDQDLRVRRFNWSAEKLLELAPVDIGRPVGHLRGRIRTPQLEGQVRKVVESLSAISEELQDIDGHWYSMGIRPYRTLEDKIAGAVITFQDIDALKRGLEASEEARQYAETLVETVREPLMVLDSDLRVQRATSAFYETFLVSREETEGRLLYDLGNGQWNRARLREMLGDAFFRSQPFHEFEVEHEFPHIGQRTMRLNARRIPKHDSERQTVLLAIEDVTERRQIAEIRYQRLFETAKDGIVVLDAETATVQDVNPFFLQLTGFERHDLAGKDVAAAGSLLGLADAADVIARTSKEEIVRYDDVAITTRQGNQVNVEAVANLYTVGTQPVVQLNVRDISWRRQAARALAASEEKFRTMVESVRDYAIFQMDDEGRVVTWNTGAERLLGWTEEEILGKSGMVIFTPEDVERGSAARELETAFRNGCSEDERWHIRKDGTRFFASGVLSRSNIDNGQGLAFTKVMQDITVRKEQQDSLKRSVEEKSMLVREIHHRVKNNLQMIVSLLNLQSRHTGDPQVLAAFEDTQSRVRAVAHIHEQLYASDDLSEVETGAYTEALARELVALHATVPGKVTLQLTTQKLVLHIEKAIPVALIANELILNSLKHGFPTGTGELHVSLTSGESDNGVQRRFAKLCVQDSGPGFPSGFDPTSDRSMGFRLINLLVRQLKARFEIVPGPGAKVVVTFPID